MVCKIALDKGISFVKISIGLGSALATAIDVQFIKNLFSLIKSSGDS
ncbi:hypothetical protein PRO82_000396 [Candidatus Protochlamydia amoebophila]|nr:hypothetical protein [Candidatus Protochlamydia amoebophila]